MAKLSQLEELDVAIRLAAKDSDPKTPSFQVAESFYESNRTLIEQTALAQWAIEKLSFLIGRHRARTRRENDAQFVMESGLGFTKLPRRIEVKGKRIKRAEATLEVFRKLVTHLRERKSPALVEAQAAGRR